MNQPNDTPEPSLASAGSVGEVLAKGIADIIRIATEPDWIPVTERLPPHDETVLYTCDLGPNEGFTDVESGRWEGERNDTGLPAMRPVWGDEGDWEPCSHWMPLPAPPTDSK
jgi:hypothetical protein